MSFRDAMRRMDAAILRTFSNQIINVKSGDIIEGVYTREYVETLDIQGNLPVLTGKTSDLTLLNRGDKLEIDGAIFLYIRSEPDGSGMSRALLEAT